MNTEFEELPDWHFQPPMSIYVELPLGGSQYLTPSAFMCHRVADTHKNGFYNTPIGRYMSTIADLMLAGV